MANRAALEDITTIVIYLFTPSTVPRPQCCLYFFLLNFSPPLSPSFSFLLSFSCSLSTLTYQSIVRLKITFPLGVGQNMAAEVYLAQVTARRVIYSYLFYFCFLIFSFAGSIRNVNTEMFYLCLVFSICFSIAVHRSARVKLSEATRLI